MPFFVIIVRGIAGRIGSWTWGVFVFRILGLILAFFILEYFFCFFINSGFKFFNKVL
jgi:hypothetical protein